MGYFDHRPELFRWIFGSLAGCLVAVTTWSIISFGSSPTDENWFRDPVSRLAVSARVPGAGPGDPAVEPGDLLVAVGEHSVATEPAARSLLDALKGEAHVRLTLERPATTGTIATTVRRADIPPSWITDLGPFAQVIAVIEGGASDRAGMHVGDLIVSVNGKPAESAANADVLLRQGTIGKSIEYGILRNNRPMTLHVMLAAFGFPIALLVLVAAGLFWMGTGIFLGLARPKFAAARLLGFSSLFIGTVLSVALLQRGIPPGAVTVVRNVLVVVFLFYGLSFSLHAGHYFPRERPEMLRNRWIRLTGYLAPIPLVALTFIVGGSAGLAGLAGMAAVVIVPHIIFYRRAAPEFKRMNTVIRWSSVAAGAGSAGIIFLVLRAGEIAYQVGGYAGVFLALIPAAHLYTIGRYRLFDLDLRVRKNVQYSLASLIWTLGLVAAFTYALILLSRTELALPHVRITGASIEIVQEPLPPATRALAEKIVLMPLAVVLALILWWIGRGGHRTLERLFHRGQYDYRHAVQELGSVMSSKLELSDLARGMVESITRLMKIKRAGVLFLRDDRTCCCIEAEGFDGAGWSSFCVDTGGEIVRAVQSFRQEFRVEYLPPPVRATFEEAGFAFGVPIRSRDRLLGLMLVGEKRSEAPFHREDLEFLSAASRQASVALENAFLHDELTEQERLKHELAIARHIQLASLPQTTPQIPGMDIAGVSIPALEVGGDYFDYLNGDMRALTVIIGDVSGKGTSAALYLSRVQGILRSLHAFGLPPRELFVRTNSLLCRDMEKKSFVTAMGAFFVPEEHRLVLARAGHLPLFHYRKNSGSVSRIIPRGLGLGLNAEGIFAEELEERPVPYDPGDVFLFITDGVTEAQRAGGEQFGEERVEDVLRTSAGMPAREITERLVAAVRAFAGDRDQHDDQTVVVVRTS